jgi:hypothetical protein
LAWHFERGNRELGVTIGLALREGKRELGVTIGLAFREGNRELEQKTIRMYGLEKRKLNIWLIINLTILTLSK